MLFRSNPDTQTLGSPQNLVWRERVLVASIEKLLAHRFEWVLAGHGDRVKLPVRDMRAKLAGLLERRRASAGAR